MALYWDTTNVNKDGITDEAWPYEHQSMCFATMALGINEITESNWQEFYGRYVLNNFDSKPSELFITPAMVKRWIGLKTNASKKTDHVFKNEVWHRQYKWAMGLADKAE